MKLNFKMFTYLERQSSKGAFDVQIIHIKTYSYLYLPYSRQKCSFWPHLSLKQGIVACVRGSELSAAGHNTRSLISAIML